MGGGLARTELSGFRVYCHQLPFANAVSFPELRRIVGDTPGTRLPGLRSNGNGRFSGTGRDKLGGQRVSTAEEQSYGIISNNSLSLVIWVTVLQPRQILKHAGHTDIP